MSCLEPCLSLTDRSRSAVGLQMSHWQKVMLAKKVGYLGELVMKTEIKVERLKQWSLEFTNCALANVS